MAMFTTMSQSITPSTSEDEEVTKNVSIALFFRHLVLQFFGINISSIRLISIFYQSSVSQTEARLSRKRQTEQIENLELRLDTEKDLVLPVVAEMEVCAFAFSILLSRETNMTKLVQLNQFIFVLKDTF